MRFEGDVRIAKPRVAWPLLALALVLFVSLGVLTNWRPDFFNTLLLAGFALYALLGATRTPKKPGEAAHRVIADARGLSLDGEMYMDHAAIERFHCDERRGHDGRYVVHVEGRSLRRGCAIYVDSLAEARALVAALAAAPSPGTAHFRALPPWAKHFRWLAILLTASPWVIFNLVRLVPAWAVGLLVALYGVVLLPTVLPQRVDVGHDGIFLRWLGNKRFIPFSAIEIVSGGPLGVDLFLRGSGRYVEIRLTQKDGAKDAHVKELVARIKEGIAAHSNLARTDEEAFLARTGRNLDTWMREMRALGAGEMGGYRAAAIPRERLWAVVENPAADPSAREGAALALSASLDEDDRSRLSALALQTAQPRLRIALDGVSREKEEARLRIALETAESTENELEEPEAGAPPAAARAAPSETREK